MKKIFYILLAFLFLPCAAFGQDLEPTYATNPAEQGLDALCMPIDVFEFCFDESVKADPDVVCTLCQDGSPYLTGKIEVDSNWVGSISVRLGEMVLLPKGKTYTFTLPEGAVWSEADPSRVCKEQKIEFTIPETFTGKLREQRDSLATYFKGYSFELAVSKSKDATYKLYREGEYECDVPFTDNGEWGYGLAKPVCNGLTFEKGVHYTFILPEGSVHAIWRDDIVNEELRYDFVGNYVPTEPKQPEPMYFWNNFLDIVGKDTFGVFKCMYQKPVKLTEEARVTLDIDGVEVKDAVLSISEVNPFEISGIDYGIDQAWMLSCDFEDYPCGRDYYRLALYIYEGSLIYDGQPLPAQCITGEPSSIAAPTETIGKTTGDVYNLQGIRVMRNATREDLSRLPAGVYIHNGKKLVR